MRLVCSTRKKWPYSILISAYCWFPDETRSGWSTDIPFLIDGTWTQKSFASTLGKFLHVNCSRPHSSAATTLFSLPRGYFPYPSSSNACLRHTLWWAPSWVPAGRVPLALPSWWDCVTGVDWIAIHWRYFWESWIVAQMTACAGTWKSSLQSDNSVTWLYKHTATTNSLALLKWLLISSASVHLLYRK